MNVCPTCGGEYPPDLSLCPRDRTPLQGLSRVATCLDERYLLSGARRPCGVGEHYLGQDLKLGKTISVRVVHDQLPGWEPAHVILRRHPALAALRHPHLIAIEDWGVTSDYASFYVSEPLWGATLQDRLLGRKADGESAATPTTGEVPLGPPWLDPLHACAIAVQIARGLHPLHGIGLIYEALHPRHVLLFPEGPLTPPELPPRSEGAEGLLLLPGVVKLLDFGNARHSGALRPTPGRRGLAVGHPEYLAPERALGGQADPRADQYSLGCLLFQMLTGQVPFRGRDRHETLWLHQHGSVRLPSFSQSGEPFPVALDLLLQRALQKRPEQRFSSMAALEEALHQAMVVLRLTRQPAPLPRALRLPQSAPVLPPPRRQLDAAWLLVQSEALRALGDPRVALRRAQEQRERLGGQGAPQGDRAACLLLVADMYRGLGERREAEVLYVEALRLLATEVGGPGPGGGLREAALEALQELLRTQPRGPRLRPRVIAN